MGSCSTVYVACYADLCCDNRRDFRAGGSPFGPHDKRVRCVLPLAFDLIVGLLSSKEGVGFCVKQPVKLG